MAEIFRPEREMFNNRAETYIQ